ncbi:hypothetical protein [Dyadobacter sandarakinus]|uniref:Addiction module component n=1 Tax=Dyadobacter sandarakinus TaxID=2747268 RepID=A0ABX7I7E9_9BACT|nr:hypothetical protein [Dyadobacter sandarakinus]QRR01844.1 hypothetical protein HWI92_13455 [Dyadobacter sandarakinus]
MIRYNQHQIMHMLPIQGKTPQPETLTDIQISILRLFNQGITEHETLEVRSMLLDYFDKALKSELSEVEKHKQYSTEDYRKMLSDDQFAVK